jgi:hypothetical protein
MLADLMIGRHFSGLEIVNRTTVRGQDHRLNPVSSVRSFKPA